MYRSAAGSDYFKLAQPGEKALHIGKRILVVYLILGGKRVGTRFLIPKSEEELL